MYNQIFTLILFAIVTAFTPGPNNISAAYSGFNFGFKKDYTFNAWSYFWMDDIVSFDGVRSNNNFSKNKLFTNYYKNFRIFIFDLSCI